MTNPLNSSILVINCGSSSLKFSSYNLAGLKLEISGNMSGIGEGTGYLKITNGQGQMLENKRRKYSDLKSAVKSLIILLKSDRYHVNLVAIGHRLVQGGPDHREPQLITIELLQQLHEFVYLAPNHLPGELDTVKAFRSAFPKIPQMACFDTAFHKDLPAYVKHYPLPEAYQKKGLIKYGFHGLSYAYILQKLLAENPAAVHQKIIIAHLGNGASMAAINNGECRDTTMGLSPIGGLVMSTRSGDLDPGVILFLLKQYHLNVDQLDGLLSKQSGLIAIAGIGDMEALLTIATTDSSAALAIQVFCYQAKKHIGALAAALGGLDLLVFTGGIGANSPIIREYICRDMSFLGIELNKRANLKNQETISLNTSRVSIRALPTHEELIIAQAVSSLLNPQTKN